MAAPYTTVVGLEVHVQLLTRTKLFCGCPNRFGLPPNTATCPVCLGLPGSLPVMNREAVRLAVKAGLALNCAIASHPGQPPGFTKWDRKNYFYPDLPKNYQVSQYDLPVCHDGWLEVEVGGRPKRVGIIRAHLEEDAGKNLHDESGRGGDTKVDLNRTGTPLLEIVTRPELNSAEEAVAFLEEVRLMLRELGVSDCEMQEGSLRCDANVNVHVLQPDGTIAATPLTEVKNLNSFRAVGRAIGYEAARQYEAFRADPDGYRIGKVAKATAGWDDARGRAEVQRHKEEAADYRYFPDPDLVPLVVSAEQVAAARADLGELPAAQRARLQSQYGLSAYDAGVFVAKGRPVVAYLEAVAAGVGDGKAAANRITGMIFPKLVERNEPIEEFPVSPEQFAAFMIYTQQLNSADRLAAFEECLTDPEILAILVAKGTSGLQAVRKEFSARWDVAPPDEAALKAAVRAAVANNPKAVADVKAGKAAAANKIKGEVMKALKKAPADVVQRLLDEELAKA